MYSHILYTYKTHVIFYQILYLNYARKTRQLNAFKINPLLPTELFHRDDKCWTSRIDTALLSKLNSNQGQSSLNISAPHLFGFNASI